jgi:signal transduction histidine kinase
MGKDIPAAFPVTFLVTRANELVYSLGNLGLFVLSLDGHRRGIRLYGTREGLPINYVQELIEDQQGRIWCGTFQDGVRMVDPGAGQNPSAVSNPSGGKLPEQPVRSLLVDRHGRIWIGMRSTGIVLLSGDSVRMWTMASGLPSNTVWSMTEDSTGGIWVGTASGAARIDAEGKVHVEREPALRGANVFDCGTFHSGRLWFLSSEGLIILDPAEEHSSAPAASVYITDVSFNGNPVSMRNGVEYPSDMNTLTAAFVTPSYFDEQGNTYRFRLLPREEAWHGPVTEGHVTYALLPPGTYTLEVRGSNARGSESPSAASFSFTITQPVWTRWWFLGGLGMGMLVIVVWAIRAHELRRIDERMQAIERRQGLDRERLRISQDMHDEIGSTLTEIILLSELSRRAGTPAEMQAHNITVIAEKSRAVVTSISEIIWAINPRFSQAEDLFAYIRQYATQFCETAGLQCLVNVPDGEGKVLLSTEQRRNVFLVVKESLRNIVRHSAASSVEISIVLSGADMTMSIADNGRGFVPESNGSFGSGLESMRKRMADLGGVLGIESRPGSGTTLRISLKLGIAKPQEDK